MDGYYCIHYLRVKCKNITAEKQYLLLYIYKSTYYIAPVYYENS